MNNYIRFTIFCLTVMSGCGNHSTKEIKSVSTIKFINLIDTISIEIQADLLGKYLHWTISDDNFFVAYNHHLHRIDVFSLDQMSFNHSIQLYKRGPNGISSVGDVLKIGDNYIIDSGSYYYRISKEGSVINKIAHKEFNISKNGYIFYQKGPGFSNFEDISLDKENNCIYRPIYKYQEDGDIDFSSLFMCSINFVNWTSGIIQIKYPETFVESYLETVFLGDGNMLRNGHLLIFNFPGANEVYVYNTITQQLKTHDPFILNRNKMKINLSDYSNDAFLANFYGQQLSPRYLGIKYNGTNNTYYRMHKTKARGENMFDTDYFLIKMDSNFNTVAQYKLGDNFSPIFQIHNGYLYFAPQAVDEDALYNLKLYKIKG